MEVVTRIFKGRGGKSGSTVHTPYESANTLQSKAFVRVIDLLSEGPIEGFCDSLGVPCVDAQMLSSDQPTVVNGALYYDYHRYDIEFDDPSKPETSPYLLFARISTSNPSENEALFGTSSGYPFSFAGDGLRVYVSGTFVTTPNSSSFPQWYKDWISQDDRITKYGGQYSVVPGQAEIYLRTYPRTTEDQAATVKTISQDNHLFPVGAKIWRRRLPNYFYVWQLQPEGVSPFDCETRIVTEVVGPTAFKAVLHPVCPEGRVFGLYVKDRGLNYLVVDPIAVNDQGNIEQPGHNLKVGDIIYYNYYYDYHHTPTVGWVLADRETNFTAKVTEIVSSSEFKAYRHVVPPPKINLPSSVAASIYLDDVPLANAKTLEYNYANVKLDYRLGYETQTPLLGFDQTETIVHAEQTPEIERNPNTPDNPSVTLNIEGLWDELIVNLMLPNGLYRQDLATGDVLGLGDGYSDKGLPTEANSLPDNEPPVFKITYQLKWLVKGDVFIDPVERPFGADDGLVVIKGKTMAAYEMSVRGSLVNVSQNVSPAGYKLNFYRKSKNDSEYQTAVLASLRRFSSAVVTTVTGLVNVRMTYPFCAVVGMEIDAEQFSSIPTRSYRVKLMQVQVPTNYFPPQSRRERYINGVLTVDYRPTSEYCRTPDGNGVYTVEGEPVTQVWDGTFYQSWTDNPAWICYALCTDTRIGFGNHIQQANKWLFYKVSRYCDELIETDWDGEKFTSKEPRFSCSCYFQTADDAWRVLADVASSFSGYLYYQSGTVIPVQDCPRASRFSFGPANVQDGFFSYTGIHKSGRYSSVVAKFANPANEYKLTPVVDQDEELMGQLGWKPLEKSAFGCTSEGQARRFARKLLISGKELTTTVKFTTGLLGSVLRPGDVIEVYDPTRSSMPFAGRILAIQNDSLDGFPRVSLDRLITAEQLNASDAEIFASYGLVCQCPTGVPTAADIADEVSLAKYAESQLTAPLKISAFLVDALGNTVVSLIEPVPPKVEVGFIWALKRLDVQPQKFQVITVEEQSKHKFGVFALEYQEAIYNATDYDAAYYEPPINPDLDAWKRPHSPRNLQILIWPKITDSGQTVHTVNISWSPPAEGFAKAYQVEWKRGWGNYQVLTTTQLTFADTVVSVADNYCARVRTVGLTGALSAPIELCKLIGVVDPANKEVISGLEITGQANDLVFVASDVSFDWRVNWSEATSEYQTGIPPVLPPSVSDYEVTIFNLAMEAIWIGSRTDTSFILSLDSNKALSQGPHREFIFGVRARTYDGSLSRQTVVRVLNERPPVPTFTFESDLNGYLLLKFTPQNYPDFSHFQVWLSTTINFTPADVNLVYSGSSTVVSLAIDIGQITYVRIAAVDTLANNSLDCEISNQFSVTGKRVGALTVFDFLTPGWSS